MAKKKSKKKSKEKGKAKRKTKTTKDPAKAKGRAAKKDMRRHFRGSMYEGSQLYEGWMEKLSRRNRWQRRYFSARGHYIKYFSCERKQEVKGVVDLNEISECVRKSAGDDAGLGAPSLPLPNGQAKTTVVLVLTVAGAPWALRCPSPVLQVRRRPTFFPHALHATLHFL